MQGQRRTDFFLRDYIIQLKDMQTLQVYMTSTHLDNALVDVFKPLTLKDGETQRALNKREIGVET